MITVSFACNNPDNGVFDGRVRAVTIHGEPDIELEGKWFPEPSNRFALTDLPEGAPSRCDRGFKIGRHQFPCYGWTPWFGNWCWDATRMTGIDVLVLVRTLRDMGYRCTASEATFGEAYDEGAEISPKLMQEALA